jgi:phosphate transport system protein
MRDAYHEELEAVSATLVEMANMAGVAMAKATIALQEANLSLAEEVIAADDAIDDLQHQLDAKVVDIMARQQPVAGDLRALVTSLRVSADLERMGDFAHHVARVARMRYPEKALPPELTVVVGELGSAAQRIVSKTAYILQTKDAETALELERDDDEVDRLHRQLFRILLDPSWSHGIENAIDTTLIGRYYERFADHAVSVGRRVHYLVTGAYSSKSE